MAKQKKPKPLTLAARSKLCEPFDAASPERDLCQKCELFQSAEKPFAPVLVPPDWTGEILIVDEQPSQDKRVDKALAALLAEAGYPRRSVAMAYAVRCAGTAEPSMAQIRCCRPFLLQAIKELAPRTLLGIGTVTAKAIKNDGQANVTTLRGRVVAVEAIASTEPQGSEHTTPGGESA